MKTFTICGSMRFAEEMKKIASYLRSKNLCNVLEVAYVNDMSNLSAEDIKKLQNAHYAKIDISDGIFVVDVNGYIGESVKREIEYAKTLHKEIIYLSKTNLL